MKPLIVLISIFVLNALVIKIGWQRFDFALSARIAMSVMLLFTSLGHFKFSKGMAMMIPDAIPFKLMWIYATGIFEILAAIGLALPDTFAFTGWVLIAFFIIMLPANINAAIKKIDYEKATFHGRGKSYLWFRVPLQLFFIAWVYLAALR